MIINIAGGTGLMGGVHKPIFEKAGHKVIISGRNTDPGFEEATKMADLTIVSVPIDATKDMIERLAPYCEGKAMMDFTGVKTMPLEAMLRYAPRNCEVGGMHPLYGPVKSIKGRTIVYCPTEKSGEKCKAVLDALTFSGGRVRLVGPETHDKIMDLVQNVRMEVLEAYGSVLASSGISVENLYTSGSKSARIMMDLIARQSDESKDHLNKVMREHNPNNVNTNAALLVNSDRALDYRTDYDLIIQFFGDRLRGCQERAGKLARLSENPYGSSDTTSMNPENYQKSLTLTNNLNLRVLEAYVSTLANSGFNFDDLYELAPSPTKILIDLFAREMNKGERLLYTGIMHGGLGDLEFKARSKLTDAMVCNTDYDAIREFFGERYDLHSGKGAELIKSQPNL